MEVKSVTLFMWNWVNPTLGITGIVLNLVIVAVATQKKMRRTSIGAHIVTMAFIDIAMLSVKLTQRFAAMETKENRTYCGGIMISSFFLNLMEAGAIVNISVERLTSVKYILKHKIWFSRVRVLRTIVGIIIISFTVSIPGVLVSQKQELKKSVVALCYFTSTTKFEAFYSIFHLFVSSVIPIPVLIAISIVTIKEILKKSATVNTTSADRRKRNRANTLSLTMVPVIFCSIKLPLLCNYVAAGLIQRTEDDEGGVAEFLRVINEVLILVNASINLALYCWKGTLFYKELVGMGRQICVRKKVNKVHVQSISGLGTRSTTL